jgi:molybdopterin/thiamine biosynthesis adenylyltransferase
MEARVIVNEICVKERKPLIEAGAYRRAYGGQVHVVQPGMSPCYQCFLMAFPGMAQDQEIASQDQADRMAYSDRLLTAEPGLANDIAPINHMVVKLALQRLLVGKPTAMRCLDEDLVAPFYIWLNRREPGTDYERLGPLQFNVDGLRILRWYGVRFDRNAACPCCGDFIGKGGNVGDLHADVKYLDMCKEPDQK